MRKLKALGIAILSLFSPTRISKRGKVLIERRVRYNSPLVKVLRLFYDTRQTQSGDLRIILRRHNRG